MLNAHCNKCENKTKLWLGKEKTFICEQASVCPFTQKRDGEENKLILKKVYPNPQNNKSFPSDSSPVIRGSK